MRVRAAVALEPGSPLAIDTVELEGPREGEVLVQIMATGVCHTDAFALAGHSSTTRFPTILGHEGAGVVVEIGKGVDSVAPGDHVIPLYVPECRRCDDCLSGRSNVCRTIRPTRDRGVMPDGTSRFSLQGQTVYHFNGTSTFAQYTVLPEIALARIREDAPFEQVCYIGCGVTTGVGAAIYSGNVRPGDKVVVFGLGGIGLNVVQGARIAGAGMIIGVDPNADRRAVGERLGMTHFFDPRAAGNELVPAIVALTRGGADVAFEAVGDVKVMRQALDVCRLGWGTCVIIGLEEAGAEMAVRPVDIRYGKTLKGSYFGGIRGRTQLPQLVDWYMEGRLVVDDLITEVLPLEHIDLAFERMRTGAAIRTVIRF